IQFRPESASSTRRRAISRINGSPSARGRRERQLRGPWANHFQVTTYAPVAQQNSAAGFEPDGRGCNSCREHPFPHVAQLEGGAPLRTETVRVQILPWGP